MKSAKGVHIAWESFVKGNREAFGEIYDHYHRDLTLYCLGRLKAMDLAENAASDCLVKLLQLKDPDKIENLDHWIFTVAKNLCNTHWSKNNRRGTILKQIGDRSSHHSKPEIEGKLSHSDIDNMLQTVLGEEIYNIWQLHQAGYNNEEISEKLGFKVKTIANKKSVARQLIKEALSKKISHFKE